MGAALAHAVREIKILTVKRVRIEVAPVVHFLEVMRVARHPNLHGSYDASHCRHPLAVQRSLSRLPRRARVQHPRQIDPSSIFSTRASSLSIAEFVPSSGPFIA